MFWIAVLVLVVAGLALFSTPLWWVPAVAGLALAGVCFATSRAQS